MPDERYPGLHVQEDERVKRFSWIGQRVQYAVFGLVIIAALAGLAGGGPLSSIERASGNLVARYDRFQRIERPGVFKFDFPAEGSAGAEIRFDRRVIEEWRIESVQPEPRSVSVDDRSVIYRFEASGRAHAVFHLAPQRSGSRSFTVVHGEESVSVATFVYP